MNRSDRFATLNRSYAHRAGLSGSIERFSTVEASVKALSHFSDYNEMTMPLKVTGRLITAGKYSDALLGGDLILSPEELQKSANKWIGVKLFKSHATFQALADGGDPPIDDVVGKITSVMWNANEQALEYFAEIYDRDIAYKIMKGVVNYVSVGFARAISEIRKGIFNVFNIDPKEVSLVFNPRDKKASIMPMM